MTRLYDNFVHSVTVEGKTYRVFPFFNRVLEICDLQERDDMTEEDIIQTQFSIITNGKYKADVQTAIKVINSTFEAMSGEKKATKTEERYFDFNQDAFLIYAAFRQTYGIDLNKERDKLHYQAFIALFSALPENTRMAQVMKIRATEIPKPNKHNAKEIQQLLKLKEIWRLKKQNNNNSLKESLYGLYQALMQKVGD